MKLQSLLPNHSLMNLDYEVDGKTTIVQAISVELINRLKASRTYKIAQANVFEDRAATEGVNGRYFYECLNYSDNAEANEAISFWKKILYIAFICGSVDANNHYSSENI